MHRLDMACIRSLVVPFDGLAYVMADMPCGHVEVSDAVHRSRVPQVRGLQAPLQRLLLVEIDSDPFCIGSSQVAHRIGIILAG